MPEVALYNSKGKEVGTLSLPDSVFGVQPNLGLIHQAVTTEEANQRQGTADTKTRGEVRGGGRKPWRQKGTGRARQGSTRAPHWRHGGVVHGPHPRSYTKSFPKAMRQSAMRSALSSKVADGELIGIDALGIDGETPSTKSAVTILRALPLGRDVRVKRYENDERVEATRVEMHKVLLIVPEYDETLLKSVRNLPNVTLRYAPNFSVRDVMAAGRIVLAEGAVARIEETLTKLEALIAAVPEVKEPAKRAGKSAEVEEKPAKKRAAPKSKAESEEKAKDVEPDESAEPLEAVPVAESAEAETPVTAVAADSETDSEEAAE